MRQGLIAAFAAVIAFAGCGPKAEEAAASSPADGWVVDKAESRLEFTATQTDREFSGRFETFEASIAFDPADLSSSTIEVVVDMTSAKTGDRQRDAALPTSDWFAAKAFPKALYRASEIVSTGEGAYEAHGALTIRDATRDLVLPFTLAIDGARAIADGEASLVRTDFGVGQGEFQTDEWVGFDVTVTFHIEATR
ncbi:MAG: YceI family protein [Pseudomonadota bacterium]